ncbi:MULTISPECIES: hypothetical protein [Streptomyces violaceoruber group]|jgi:hypothetical protein|uniref:hypothetical protein n=1 Tax=Streptomyces violaceoruber group TaxID=2867121 RepID=UPI0004C7E969|nr:MULTISPECIES: hypothetical protein [Streptomyces anthocyanicus group]GHC27422.1 hypothetical protein GCM10010348_61810 [Streptomyces anthocyanicus]
MSDTGKAVVGRRPLVFTDTDGSQRFVPLSAFEIDANGEIKLMAEWQETFGPADSLLLVGLATRAREDGEIAAAPEAPSLPAVVFKAAVQGSEGNNIKVMLACPEPEKTTAQAAPAPRKQKTPQLTVVQSEVYRGLAKAADAAKQIGTDQLLEGSGDPIGTGLVQVKAGTAKGEGLPDRYTKLIKEGEEGKVMRDGKGAYLTLVLRKGLPKTVREKGVQVTISVDPTAKTYDVEAVYTSKPHSFEADAVIPLTGLPEEITDVVGVSAPPRGYAPPGVPQTVTLRGGGPGVAASATAYTS